MKEEEFDALFRSKIETDDAKPIWNEAKVWQKIENSQQKKRLVYWPYAASVAALLGIYWVFTAQNSNQKPVLSAIKKSDLTKNQVLKPANQLIANEIKTKRKEAKFQIKNSVSEIVVKEILQEEKPKIEVVFEKEMNFKEEQKLNKEPISLVFEEKAVAALEQKEVQQNRVVVLNIPVEGEEKMIRKKRLVGRFFQQMGRFSNGHKFDWEEVNIRPKKIWAYLKSNFVADSTTYH